jgi:hypothetical protein
VSRQQPSALPTRPALIALVVGVLGLLLGLVLGIAGGVFASGYLMAFVYWSNLSLGALVLLAVNHMGGGSWGALIRRPLEAMVAALPLVALFFVPVAFGIGALYPWADPVYVAAHPLVEFKAGYLNATWYVIRAVLYFLIWIAIASFYLRTARAQDERPEDAGRLGYRMRSVSGLALVVYVITVTLAAVDWGMSLTPEWWSGIYGLIFMISQAVSAMALTIVFMVALARIDDRIDRLLNWKRLQDLGNFLMGFIMFWAYVNVSQLIIQWSGNIVETNTFYVLRFNVEPWRGLGTYLAVAGFSLPFVILLSRWVKRKRAALVVLSIWALLNQAIHTYWYLAPEVGRVGAPLAVDVLLFLGLGGVWLAFVLRNLASRGLLSEHDPRLGHPPVPSRAAPGRVAPEPGGSGAAEAPHA